MRQGLRAVFAAFAAVAVIHFFHFVGAATAQTPVKQLKLTEKQIQNFIAAQKDMAPVAKKLQGSTSDQPDPKLQAQSEAVAKNSGFNDFAEYDNVAANILMVVAGIDPLTKRYTDPQSSVKKWIANVTADRTVPEKVQKELLNEFEKVLKAAQPIQYPSNIALVTKYYDKIDMALQ
jgi:hypothetical protein